MAVTPKRKRPARRKQAAGPAPRPRKKKDSRKTRALRQKNRAEEPPAIPLEPRRLPWPPWRPKAKQPGPVARPPLTSKRSQAEEAASRRAKRYTLGLRQGGQTGGERRGLRSPSRGRKGITLERD